MKNILLKWKVLNWYISFNAAQKEIEKSKKMISDFDLD